MTKEENSFFTKEVYESEIHLDVNEDVLQRIYNDKVVLTDKLPIEFFFITDTEVKALRLKGHLIKEFPTYSDIKVQDYNQLFEINGITHPMEMNISDINQWNQQMWDIGYTFDCKLDGWQVATS